MALSQADPCVKLGELTFKSHVVEQDGRLRRLVPDELDQLQEFPKGWTSGMSDGHRAFCMGNALVTGIPHRIGKVLAADIALRTRQQLDNE